MLTAKGIGGGGSAKVTNGILQEMYAAEGEIPANTFVEKVTQIELEGGTNYILTNHNVFTESDRFSCAVALTPSRLLVCGQSGAAIFETSKNNVSTGNFTPVISDATKTLVYRALVKISETKAVVFYNIQYAEAVDIAVLDIDGFNVSVNPSITLSNSSEISNIVVAKMRDNQIALLYGGTTSSSSKWHHTVDVALLEVNGDACTIANKVSLIDEVTDNSYDGSGYLLIFPIDADQFVIRFTYKTNKHTHICALNASAIEIGPQTVGNLNLDGRYHTHYKVNDSIFRLFYTLNIWDNATIVYDEYSIDGTNMSIIQEAVEISPKTFYTYAVMPVTEEILVSVTARYNKSNNYTERYTIGLNFIFQDNNRQIVKASEFIPIKELPERYEYDSIPSVTEYEKYQTTCLFDPKTGLFTLVITPQINGASTEGSLIATLQLGTPIYKVAVSKDRVDGLTKSLCTESQKGQVWLLSTQEGEE